MQMNPNAANVSPKKTNPALIIALICIPLAFIFVMFIVVAAMFLMAGISLPYMTRTAKAQPEIIKIMPTSWSESRSSGSSKYPSFSSRQIDGYSVSYKFTTADGQTIFQTADKQRSKDVSDMAQVCYDPKNPNNCGLQREGKCP